MRKMLRILTFAAAIGIVATILSSFIKLETLVYIGYRATLYGFPFWFQSFYFPDLLPPGYYFNLLNAIADFLFWFGIAFTIALTVEVLRTRRAALAKAKTHQNNSTISRANCLKALVCDMSSLPEAMGRARTPYPKSPRNHGCAALKL